MKEKDLKVKIKFSKEDIKKYAKKHIENSTKFSNKEKEYIYKKIDEALN